MLRDVALGGTDLLNNILHADLLITKYAQDFQAQRMRNGLECASSLFDMLVVLDQLGVSDSFLICFLHGIEAK